MRRSRSKRRKAEPCDRVAARDVEARASVRAAPGDRTPGTSTRRRSANATRPSSRCCKSMAGPPSDDDDATPGAARQARAAPTHRESRAAPRAGAVCGGHDPTMMPGMADHSLLRVISEVGTDLAKWPTEKHFTAWTGLAPGAAQSGKRRRIRPRQRNRVGQYFCAMARSAGNTIDTAFGGFVPPPEGAPRRLGSQQGAGTQTRRDVLARDGPRGATTLSRASKVPGPRDPQRATCTAPSSPASTACNSSLKPPSLPDLKEASYCQNTRYLGSVIQVPG